MRVVYVARHDQHNNDDEGSIAHALAQLGHVVNCVHERSISTRWESLQGDFLLFHHWVDEIALRKVKIPKVAWTFDLIDYPDPTLRVRCSQRISWMKQIIPLIDLGFMTDGDYVAKDTSGKLVWLPQGADGRIAGFGRVQSRTIPILFVGGKNGGHQRVSCVQDLERRYGSKFVIHQKGVYREDLKNLIASSQIVVAPDGPVTDMYWSNRVYLITGFGGLMLHPYCERLAEQYRDREEILFYRDRQEMFDKVDHHLAHPSFQVELREGGLRRTLRDHLYQNRVERLIQVVQERLK